MMAGTSTGSIISASLSYPKDSDGFENNEWIPGYWAKDMTDTYLLEGANIFSSVNPLPIGVTVVLILIYLIIFGALGYYLGRRWYDNPEKEKIFKEMEKALSNQKAIMKGHKVKHTDIDVELLTKDERKTYKMALGSSCKMIRNRKKNQAKKTVTSNKITDEEFEGHDLLSNEVETQKKEIEMEDVEAK